MRARCSRSTTAAISASSESHYFAIIRGKTAEFTAVFLPPRAHYARADEATRRRLEGYGRDLGVAFQIADDVLDIWGEEHSTGKSLGTDLEKQKLTLPVIRLLCDRIPVRRGSASAAGSPRRTPKPARNSARCSSSSWDSRVRLGPLEHYAVSRRRLALPSPTLPPGPPWRPSPSRCSAAPPDRSQGKGGVHRQTPVADVPTRSEGVGIDRFIAATGAEAHHVLRLITSRN